MRSGRGVYKDFDPTLRKSINEGYIIIPIDVDRTAFIEQCLRKERFSIQVEHGGGILHNCYITKSALRDITFPLPNQQLGSGVVFFADPFSGKVVITGVVGVTDSTDINRQDTIVLKKMNGGNYALLSVNGDGQISIDIIGTATRGRLDINVRNDDSTAQINVRVKGSLNLSAEGGNVNIAAIDSDINLNATGKIQVISDQLLIHNAEEAMIKGDTLQSEIDKTNDVVKIIKESLAQWTVVPNDGGAALQAYFNGRIVNKDVGDFSNIKSEKSFLE